MGEMRGLARFRERSWAKGTCLIQGPAFFAEIVHLTSARVAEITIRRQRFAEIVQLRCFPSCKMRLGRFCFQRAAVSFSAKPTLFRYERLGRRKSPALMKAKNSFTLSSVLTSLRVIPQERLRLLRDERAFAYRPLHVKPANQGECCPFSFCDRLGQAEPASS